MRKPACIGLDEDVMKYLKEQDTSMAEFINCLVRAYKDKSAVKESVGVIKRTIANPIESELVTGVLETTEDILADNQIKIKAYFLDSPHIIYMAKTQRKFNKADLCRIKEELYFSKYNVEANIKEIRKALKESIDTFDVEAYKEKVGIKNATN